MMSRFLATVVVVLLLLGCSFALAAEGDVLRVSGSTTIQPILEVFAPLYSERTGIRVVVAGGGSTKGIQDVLEGKSQIGMVSRSLSEEEKTKLRYVTIGYDALVAIVNAANPLESITRDTLIALYTGKITNWKELTSWDARVVLVSKELGRGTLEVFSHYTGLRHPQEREKYPEGPFISDQAFEVGANLEALTLVGGIPNAVGYVSMGTALDLIAKGMPVKVLVLGGVKPSPEVVRSGEYPMRRELNLVYTDESALVQDVLNFFLSPEGQNVVLKQGFIPVK